MILIFIEMLLLLILLFSLSPNKVHISQEILLEPLKTVMMTFFHLDWAK